MTTILNENPRAVALQDTIRISNLIRHHTQEEINAYNEPTITKCLCRDCNAAQIMEWRNELQKLRDADNRFHTFNNQSSIYNMGETE